MLSITSHQESANQNPRRYPLLPVRVAVTNKNRISVVKDVVKGNPCTLLLRMYICAVSMKNSLEVPQRLKNTIWFSNFTSGCFPKGNKTWVWKDVCTLMFIPVLFSVAKIWKQPKCPLVDELIKKIWYIYTIEYYSAIKKLNLVICECDGPWKYFLTVYYWLFLFNF